MQQTEFARVTSLLVKSCGVESVAAYLGVREQTYKQMRAEPGQKHYRRPPADWKTRLRPLAASAILYYRQHADRVSAALLDDLNDGE